MSAVALRRVAIVGAGAIGGWLGVKLGLAGCEVSALARGDTLRALQADGLHMHTGGQHLRLPVRADADPAALGPQDLVVIAVKAPSLAALAPSLAPLIGPDTVVLTAMNGVPWWFLDGFGGTLAGRSLQAVDPGGAIARALPARHVVGCVVHASCSLDGPGVVRHHFGNGLIVGEPSGQPSERVQALAALLQGAGFNATVSAQIQKDIWYKLWGNMTVNPVSALTGATTDRILGDELVRGFVSAVMLEAKAIGAYIGIPIDQQPEDRHAVTLKLGAFKTSMLQDVEAKKAVELDALVSAVRELGQLAGVATPFTDALLGLSRLQAQTLGLYPAPGADGRGPIG
ncbi:2-dehydropantoate 2-reductase [Hydrogenophaga sp.]|uniref:2-dehydropantoate 2-reductase n=1 Tax=Hydrogenophaga sp. TaxID=1904254 RepID=UPI0035654467